MQDVKELYKEDPATIGAFLTILSVFGANVRTVPEPENQEKGLKGKERGGIRK